MFTRRLSETEQAANDRQAAREEREAIQKRLASEEHERWWQAFCACLGDFDPDGDEPHVTDSAATADAAIAEAKKRGRL